MLKNMADKVISVLLVGSLVALIWVYAPTQLTRVMPAQAASTAALNCGASALYDASTNGTTAIITGTSGLKTYICGFDFYSAGTNNVKLTYGTGSSCTGATAITPAFQFTAATGIVDPGFQWRGLPVVPAGNNVCIVTTAGVAVQAIVYYMPAS